MRNDATITILDIPENVTLPDGATVSRHDADAHIKKSYGKPCVGYVLPAKGNGLIVYAAFSPNVERDENGDWQRDGENITWHATFKSASRLVKKGYRSLDRIENCDEEDWWVGDYAEDNDNDNEDDYYLEAA
ncbi:MULTISPECIES: hypothetical protein [unclassified Mesorhizobium]|uniref:hypothetical protein n=1 Tax=unclassified Mesorhizobium TaxID=325217 RepID=UPI00112B5BE8|nr:MULTISPECIES: hypothetical protein [unclassified Mesorhizobium]TPJ86941.1 hypothetical protein FJ489_30780 [Mesorhizobium sp. B2-5-12]TPK19164.1 hypothetical protein FJ562_31185 [Mesorhizobium sp. B2-5-6]